MDNKKGLMFAFVFLAFLSSLNFVSAAGPSEALKPIVEMIGGIFQSVYDVLSPLLIVLVGETDDGEIFIAKIISILIVSSIIYVILSKSAFKDLIGDSKWVLFIISIAIPILGVRFLSQEWISAMVLPSSTFAVAITAGIPFVLYYFLIEGFPSKLRRVAWIFFGVIFLGLYSFRYVNQSPSEASQAAYMIYPITIFLALIMALFDGTFRRWFAGLKADNASIAHYSQRIAILSKTLEEIRNDFSLRVANNTTTSYSSRLNADVTGQIGFEKDVKYYEREIREARKKL